MAALVGRAHRSGIVLPVGYVDWARYRNLNAQRGVLLVHVQEQKRAVFSRPIGQIPNYRLFLLTVKTFRAS
ncbi:hypothetical protein [Streptacidiphilus cavernicola]|uniref:hypothetical protein n=1 Tax=Streptacidiphilus cavernicola TaxID=3342716 RepID=UPI0036D43AA7